MRWDGIRLDKGIRWNKMRWDWIGWIYFLPYYTTPHIQQFIDIFHRNHDTYVQLNNVWLIGGLGSRGLLYHALLSQLIIQEATSSRSDDCARASKEEGGNLGSTSLISEDFTAVSWQNKMQYSAAQYSDSVMSPCSRLLSVKTALSYRSDRLYRIDIKRFNHWTKRVS